MEFTFKHVETGEIKTLSLSEKEMSNLIESDVLLDEFISQECKCEPVGETNVVECSCDDYLCDFELQP